MGEETRQRAISLADGLEFKILTEVGKKDSSIRLKPIIKDAYRVLQSSWPMAQSQIYTQLIKRGALSDTLEGHKILTDALIRARQEGLIPWDWIKDEED